MRLTVLLCSVLLVGGLNNVKANDSIEVTSVEREAVSQELDRESRFGNYDAQTKRMLGKVSELFKNAQKDIEVEIDKLKTDCSDCSKEQKTKNFLTKIGRSLGKGAAWLSTTTAKPFMTASGFIKGAVEKRGTNKELVALYQFFLNHQEEFDSLYLQAGTPEEMVELMLIKIEEIMQKKSRIILKDLLTQAGINKEVPEDLSKFELSHEELAMLEEADLDASVINNHPEYKELRPMVGDVTKEELSDLLQSGYFSKAISIEKYKDGLPSIPELVGTAVGQLFVPKIALGIVSKTLAGLYMTPVVAADIGTGVSTAICLQKETRDQFEKDKDLKLFCSYVTNKTSYELLKGRANGYVEGKKFHEKMAEKLKRFKEKREEKKRQKQQAKQKFQEA